MECGLVGDRKFVRSRGQASPLRQAVGWVGRATRCLPCAGPFPPGPPPNPPYEFPRNGLSSDLFRDAPGWLS